MNMKTVLMAMAAIAAGNVCAEAQTAVWGGTGAAKESNSYAFEPAENWENGTPPANGDNVDFSCNPGTDGNRLYLETVSLQSNKARTFGTLTGTNGRVLTWNGRGSDSSHELVIANPSGFLGWFRLYGWGTLKLPATAEVSPSVGRLCAQVAFNLDVPDAGTSATVGSLFGDALLCKRGAGDVVFSRVAPGSRLMVNGGSVTIGGHGEGDALLQATLAKAALQLDASAEGALVVENGKVVRWNDVRPGATGYAAQAKRDASKVYNYPTVAEKFQNGLDAVDFGDFGNEAAACDPTTTTSALQFNSLFTNVKDAFFVEADREAQKKTYTNPHLFASGISTKIFMRPADSSALFALGTSAEIGCGKITDPLALRDGDFRVDGATVDPTIYSFTGTELKLLTFTPRDEATYVPMEMLAGEYGSRFGGIRVGEVLIFTNRLTEAERTAVSRHLLAKWKPAAVKPDVETLQFNNAANTVAVPEGDVLSVGELQTAGTTLVKDGKGTLKVGRLVGADKVEVCDGAFALDASRAVPSADPQPATGAFRHYDASDPDSLVKDDSGNLIGWKDQSGDGAKTATSVLTTPRNDRTLTYPTVIANAQNERAVIDFGDVVESVASNSNQSAAMIFDTTTPCGVEGGNAREIFVVFRKNYKGSATVYEKVFLFGNRDSKSDAYDIDFYPHYAYDRMFRPSNASQYTLGGRWTVDGLLMDPANTPYNQQWRDFHVYHGAFAKRLLTTAFCMDRGGGGLVGGAQIGEVLIYDRELTDQERIDTEAYLMTRWLAKEHPAAATDGRLASIEYAENVTAAIGNETDLTVGKLTASSDALVKSGAGDLTVVEADLANLTSVTVEGGSLAFAVRSDNPEFHFDASDLSSFEYTVTEGGQTNVTKWLDVRKNGLYAFSSRYGNCKVDPILTAKERKDGVVRPLVDFGTKNGTDSAGMEMSKAFSNILECHSVFSDANGANTMFVFTDMSKIDFHRNGSNLFRENYAPDVYYGVVEANGVRVYNPYTPNGFEVLSFQPRAAVHVGTIALDRTSSAGGCYVSEMVGFSKVLSPERHRYVMDMLVAKWGTVAGATMPVWTNELQSVTVKAGGVFRPSDDMADDFRLQSSSVAGGGTLVGNLIVAEGGTLTPGDGDAPGTLTVDGDLCLSDGATISCNLFPNVGCDSVKVNGALTCAGQVTVNVTSVGKASASAFAGEYPLIDAADDSAVDADAWTVVADAELGRRCYVSLTQHDGKIWLKVDRKGSLLIVR